MKPVDIIAIILTLTICYILSVVITMAAIHSQPLSEIGAKIVDKMTIALISIISMYVGSKLNKK